MLGDFRYCSSSESSDGDSDSDSSDKGDDHLDKLIAEKKILEEKIKEREMKLKLIQGTLKTLSDERKKLFARRNKLVTSSNQFVDSNPGVGFGEVPFSSKLPGADSDEEILPSTSAEPLNLNPQVRANDNEEEFDSDSEL